MIELVSHVVGVLIIFIIFMFAWESTRLVEEKKKKSGDRKRKNAK